MLQLRLWPSMARLKNFHIVRLRSTLHASPSVLTDCYKTDSEDAAGIAARLVCQGHLVAVPTDTIYGIAASAQNDAGIKQIYDLKRRDENKPIAVSVGDVSDLHIWGDTISLPVGLLDAILPGPVTIVLNRTKKLNPILNFNSHLVGIRVPDSDFIRQIARMSNAPLALTSANLSNEPSSLCVTEFQNLWSSLAAVFDGGRLGNTDSARQGSTVVDLSVPQYYKILRDGSALYSTLEKLHKFGLIQRDD